MFCLVAQRQEVHLVPLLKDGPVLSLGRPEQTKHLRWRQGRGIANTRQDRQGAELCFLLGHRYKSAAWPFFFTLSSLEDCVMRSI